MFSLCLFWFDSYIIFFLKRGEYFKTTRCVTESNNKKYPNAVSS